MHHMEGQTGGVQLKIAYSNLACPEWSIEQAIDRAAAYGYQGLELRLMDGGDVIHPAALDASGRERIAALARDAGIDLVGIGASTQLALADPADREHNEQDLAAYLEMAADMGVPMVRTFGGNGHCSNEEAVKRVAESLNNVASRAETLGVDVLLETHDYFSSSYLVRDVLNLVNSPRVGAVWDIFAPYSLGETVDDTYDNISASMRHLHLKDGRRTGDDWRYVFLGDGEVPIVDILRKLDQVGYTGYISVEWEKKWHPDIEPAEVALPQYLRVFNSYVTTLA